MASLKESAVSRGTMTFCWDVIRQFHCKLHLCSEISEAEPIVVKWVKQKTSDTALWLKFFRCCRVIPFDRENIFSISVALPHDPFRSLAKICKDCFHIQLTSVVAYFDCAVVTIILLLLLPLSFLRRNWWLARWIFGDLGREKHSLFEFVHMTVSARGFALFRKQDTGQLRKCVDLHYK